MAVTVLDGAPKLGALYAKAALTGRGRGGPRPETHLARHGVAVDRDTLAAYARVCGLPLDDVLPATYPHMLTFPLQMALMSDRAFPLAMVGLVHVRNRIEVLRADEPLDLEVWAERFAGHRSGATAPAGAPEADVDVAVGALERPAATWQVPGNAGRRYAKVSGDVNPIHLTGLTAKALGFKRAIAHGMWVQARVLGALAGRLPEALDVDVAFRKPLFLPSTATFSTAQVDGGWDVAVRNATSGAEHLVGTVRGC